MSDAAHQPLLFQHLSEIPLENQQIHRNPPDQPPTYSQPTPPCSHSKRKLVETECDFCAFKRTYCKKCATNDEINKCPNCKHCFRYEEKDLGGGAWALFTIITLMATSVLIAAFCISIVNFVTNNDIITNQRILATELEILKSRIDNAASASAIPAPLIFDGQCNSVIALDLLCLAFRDIDDNPVYALIARADEDRVLKAAEQWKLGQRMHRLGHSALEWCVDGRCASVPGILARSRKGADIV